mgnify:CR=1 FL=1
MLAIRFSGIRASAGRSNSYSSFNSNSTYDPATRLTRVSGHSKEYKDNTSGIDWRARAIAEIDEDEEECSPDHEEFQP